MKEFITIFVNEYNEKEEYYYNTQKEAINHMNLFKGDDYYKSVKVVKYNWTTKEEQQIAAL